jgi:hypothetical protein
LYYKQQKAMAMMRALSHPGAVTPWQQTRGFSNSTLDDTHSATRQSTFFEPEMARTEGLLLRWRGVAGINGKLLANEGNPSEGMTRLQCTTYVKACERFGCTDRLVVSAHELDQSLHRNKLNLSLGIHLEAPAHVTRELDDIRKRQSNQAYRKKDMERRR